MLKKLAVFLLLVWLSMNLCGCLAMMAAGGGAGTAVWLSGKLTQEVIAPLETAFDASKKALGSLDHQVTKATLKRDVAQVMGIHSEDQKTIWVDMHWISDKRTRIEVRVGALSDKEAARQILDKILSYL